MKQKASSSLKSTLIILRIIMGLLAVIIGFATYYLAAGRVEKEIKQDLQFKSNVVASQLQNHFEQIRLELTLFAKANEFKDYYTSPNNRSLLQYFIEKSPSFISLSYVNSEGKEVVKTVRGQRSSQYNDLSSDKYYLKTLESENGFHVSSPQYDELLNRQVIFIDYIIRDDFDDRIGYLRAAISLQRIAELIKSTMLQEKVSIYIVDRDDNIIYDKSSSKSQETAVLSRDHALWKVHTETSSLQQIFIITQLSNLKSIVSKASLPKFGWTIYNTRPYDDAMEAISQLRSLIIILSVLVILFGDILSRFLRRRITDPIDHLSTTTTEITESGFLDKRIEWQSKDEIGHLAMNFNAMLNKIEVMQAQLAHDKDFIDNIVTSMPDTLVVVDPAGQIIKVNPSLEKLLGYSESELYHCTVTDLFHADLFQAGETILDQMTDTDVLHISDGYYRHKDGTPISVTMTISRLPVHSNTHGGFVFIARDTREKRKLEKERQKVQERLIETQMELLQTEKLAVVGQMSGMVAHEVLNPMSGINVRVALNRKKAGELVEVTQVFSDLINGWLQFKKENSLSTHLDSKKGEKDLLILSKIATVLSKSQKERVEDLAFIEKLIQRVIKTIDGLREISKQKKEVKKIDLADLIDEMLIDMADGLKKRGIVATKQYVKRPVITADFMEIYSILTNIIKNAMQAIDKNQDSDVKEISIELNETQEGAASIQIRDTGIGMDEETISNVFTPGFTSKGREGTGIGMSFSRKLAYQYGGDIIVLDSKPGKGTTFQVLLEVKKAEA